MPEFIFSYRSAKDHAAADPDGLAAWGAFINEVIAPSVTDPGWPVFEPATVLGEAGPSTQLGGYAIVTADDLQAAVSMAEHCPAITRGGGVEVGVLGRPASRAPGGADQVAAVQGLERPDPGERQRPPPGGRPLNTRGRRHPGAGRTRCCAYSPQSHIGR